jgi:hypothetical protein
LTNAPPFRHETNVALENDRETASLAEIEAIDDGAAAYPQGYEARLTPFLA